VNTTKLLDLRPVAQRLVTTGWQFLYVHNPLYLISACFVLHGTSQLLPKAIDQSVPYNPWPLLALSVAYQTALAIVAVLIVRLGKVWDDARSILLIIVGLFVELSLSLDAPLMLDPRTGCVQVLLGFGVITLITELLLYGLRIRLPALFRVPYYLVVGCIFLYPLLLVRGLGVASVLDAGWGIYLFSPAAALILLTVLPAIRRGREYVTNNGSPWLWPWYPWSMLAMLAAGVLLRGYVLSLSFDPVLSQGYAAAMRLETSYGGYFAVPILLSLAVLLLEIGIIESHAIVQRVALLIPVAALILSFPAGSPNRPYADFLESYMEQLGSPVLVSAIMVAVYYAYAWIRRVRFAEPAFIVTLLLISMMRGATVSVQTLADPLPSVWWVAGAIQLLNGVMRRDTMRVVAGVSLSAAAARLGLAVRIDAGVELLWFDVWILCVILAGLVYDDPFARWIRRMSAGLLTMSILATLVVPKAFDVAWSSSVLMLCLLAVSLLWTYLHRHVQEFKFAVVNVLAGLGEFGWQCYLGIRDWDLWSGVRSYAVGFALLVAAAALSAVKGGAWARLKGFEKRRTAAE
jgi:hypothetical protein